MKKDKASVMRTVVIGVLVLLILLGAAGIIARCAKNRHPPAPVLSEKLELDKSGLLF